MVYVLLGICLSVIFFGIYIVLKKMALAQYYIAKRRRKKERKKPAITRQISKPDLVVDDLEAYEKQLFDDVATLFMQRPPSMMYLLILSLL